MVYQKSLHWGVVVRALLVLEEDIGLRFLRIRFWKRETRGGGGNGESGENVFEIASYDQERSRG